MRAPNFEQPRTILTAGGHPAPPPPVRPAGPLLLPLEDEAGGAAVADGLARGVEQGGGGGGGGGGGEGPVRGEAGEAATVDAKGVRVVGICGKKWKTSVLEQSLNKIRYVFLYIKSLWRTSSGKRQHSLHSKNGYFKSRSKRTLSKCI